MNKEFGELVESLEPSFKKLKEMEPVRRIKPVKTGHKAKVPTCITNDIRGVYLFSENNNPLYVGRTNTMRRRLQQHVQKNTSATFALKLAREAKNRPATYTPNDGYKSLIQDEDFKEEFFKQNERIESMDIQYVEEADPTRQALLEMYVAISLNTPYNDFDNH